ncbi:PID-CTERM protein-sorting domain-containing protein [Hymenobacter segetis]|uniref:VPDSG-CTERM protein sorting domain-containing protein n=1 Tax=Hymenobacter segetis TaxID=2025509 RepID=A0ABU9LWA0_9BACT
MKSILFSAASLLFFCALTSSPAVAQPNSGGPTPVPDPVQPTETPIDGGASLLLAGGVAFGLKQLRARRLARSSNK